MKQNLRAVVITGPSGVGKTTMVDMLVEKDKCGKVITHTTRNPRGAEQDGKDYHFIDRDAFLTKMQTGDFIEHAEFAGNLYGSTYAAVQKVADTGKVPLLSVDMQGVLSILKSNLEARYIMLVPPSMEELKKRLVGRGDTSSEAIERRLATALKELEHQHDSFWDKVIVSDTKERTFHELSTFLFGE